MGIGIDMLCLLSKLEMLPKSTMNDVSGTFSTIAIIELSILSPLLATVLLSNVINIIFDLRKSFCTSEKIKNNNLKSALFYSFLNKVTPLKHFENIENSAKNSLN